MRDTGEEGLILGDNPGGHYFVLWDFIPINFF